MDQQLNYQYIQVPMNLFYLMDANCSKVLTTLVQMNSYYPKEDGYFVCTYKTLELACGLSQNLIKASLSGLYLEGVIDVISVGKGRGKHTNKYKVNIEKFKDYEKINLGIAIMTEDKPIHQVKYKGERFQVPWNEKTTEKESEKGTEKRSEKKVTTNITNIENTKEYNIINNKEEDMKVIPVEDKDTFYDDNERNIVMSIEENKECTDEELKTIYINSFGELMNNYPGINYSLIKINDKDSFYDCYKDIVDESVMKVKQESKRNISYRVYLESLNIYLKYIQYSYQ